MNFVKYKAYELQQEYDSIISNDLTEWKHQDKEKISMWLQKVIFNFNLDNHLEMSRLYTQVAYIWTQESNFIKSQTYNKTVMHLCYKYVSVVTAPGVAPVNILVDAVELFLQNLNSSDLFVVKLSLEGCAYLNINQLNDGAIKWIWKILREELVPNNEPMIRMCLESLLVFMKKQNDAEVLHKLLDVFRSTQFSPTLRAVAISTYLELNGKAGSLYHQNALEIFQLFESINEWDKSAILSKLTINYVPQTPAQVSEMLYLSLNQLKNSNTSVFLQTMKFVMYLLNYTNSTEEINEIAESLINGIKVLMNKPFELRFLILRNVILLLLTRSPKFFANKFDISYFFIDTSDPIFIKDTKLEILYLLANEANIDVILDELKEYCMDIDILMSRKAIRAIGNLGIKLENEIGVKESIQHLLELFQFFQNSDYIIEELVSVFKNIFRKHEKYATLKIISTLLGKIDTLDESESQSSMIWFLSNFFHYDPLGFYKVLDTHYYSQMVINGSSAQFDNFSFEVQCGLLNSLMKVSIFFRSEDGIKIKEAGKIRHEIVQTMKRIQVSNPDIRDKVLIYQRLLDAVDLKRVSLQDCVKIVDTKLPFITLNDLLDPVMLENLELEIGSTASVFLKPVNQIFRQDVLKFLPPSDILNLSSRNNTNDNTTVIHTDSPFTDGTETIPDSRSSSSMMHQSNGGGGGGGKNLSDYDKPVDKINTVKRKKTLVRKPSLLLKSFSFKN